MRSSIETQNWLLHFNLESENFESGLVANNLREICTKSESLPGLKYSEFPLKKYITYYFKGLEDLIGRRIILRICQ